MNLSANVHFLTRCFWVCFLWPLREFPNTSTKTQSPPSKMISQNKNTHWRSILIVKSLSYGFNGSFLFRCNEGRFFGIYIVFIIIIDSRCGCGQYCSGCVQYIWTIWECLMLLCWHRQRCMFICSDAGWCMRSWCSTRRTAWWWTWVTRLTEIFHWNFFGSIRQVKSEKMSSFSIFVQ